jgi:DNA-binding CsgD family transcriptional regulator
LFEALISRIGSEDNGCLGRPPDTKQQDGSRTLFELSINGARYLVRREVGPEAAQQPKVAGGNGRGELTSTLSPREHEIARMIARGHPNKTIAIVLEISCWTVGTHIRRIFAKLGVASRAAMIAKLMEDGWSGDAVPSTLSPHGHNAVQHASATYPSRDDEPAHPVARVAIPAGPLPRRQSVAAHPVRANGKHY